METKQAPETATLVPDQPPAPQQEQPKADAVAVAQPQAPKPAPRVITPVVDDTETMYIMDTARFDQAQRVALTMARSTLTPQHLTRDKSGVFTLEQVVANCFRIVNQALRWGMDPFAVMDETYFVQGRMGYQGKLVVAVVNTRAGLKSRLTATYEGAGDNRKVTVSGTFSGEMEPRTVEWTVAQGKTEGNAMWKKDPDQKLFYSAAMRWARRHCPEVVLGVSIVEDLETIAEEQRSPGDVHVMTELEMARHEVYEKMPAYIGRDKPELEAQCRDAVRNKRDTVEFWHGILAQIEPPQK
jgi:hypothetical protein